MHTFARIAVRQFAALAALALAFAGPPAAARAATYYVAPSGNDNNAGSQAAPWQTLQKAGDIAGAGDDVIVLPGTYQGFRPRKSGTAQSPVRFLAQPGVVVTSPGPSNSNNDNIWVRNVEYVVIQGFESTGSPRSGIAIQGEPDANVDGIVIRACHCHHNSRWGIFTGFARDLLLEDNETSYSAIEHGIYVSNSGDRPIVRRNHAHHNVASGIQLNADPIQQGDDPSDPQGDGIIEGALIEANVIHDNGSVGGAAINLASVRTSLIRNNLLYANVSTGIAGWDDGEGSLQYGTRANRIVGNTILQSSNGRFAISLKNASFGNTVLNNVIIHPGARGSLDVDPSSQQGLVSDYNIVVNRFSDDDAFFTLAQWQAFGFDAHSIVSTAAAVFVNAAANDYHLAATSPARDAGTSLADLPTDLDGVARPQGSGSDIGAYELTAVGTPAQTATVPAATATATRTPTRTPTSTPTRTPTASPTRTSTATPTRTPSASPTRTATQTSTPTATPTGRDISGHILYRTGDRPVPGVTVQLTGDVTMSTSTIDGGDYALSGLPDGNYRVEPAKQGDSGLGVTSADATCILQALVGLRQLDALQYVAADVTGNGTVTSLDAARILQFMVRNIDRLPVAAQCDSDWLFVPEPVAVPGQTAIEPAIGGGVCAPGAITYTPLSASAADQDFRAILLGDCTGNWAEP